MARYDFGPPPSSKKVNEVDSPYVTAVSFCPVGVLETVPLFDLPEVSHSNRSASDIYMITFETSGPKSAEELDFAARLEKQIADADIELMSKNPREKSSVFLEKKPAVVKEVVGDKTHYYARKSDLVKLGAAAAGIAEEPGRGGHKMAMMMVVGLKK